MRVVSKIWKERLNDRGTVVTHTESVCPDAGCQAVVDGQFAAIRERKVAADEKRAAAALLKKTEREAALKAAAKDLRV